MRFVLVRSARSCWEFTNLVNSGVPFQKTTAAVSKLSPSTSIVNGTLLTGALLGNNVVMKGGEEEDTLNVPRVALGLCEGLPHPKVNEMNRTRRLAGRKRGYRIVTSCYGPMMLLLLRRVS